MCGLLQQQSIDSDFNLIKIAVETSVSSSAHLTGEEHYNIEVEKSNAKFWKRVSNSKQEALISLYNAY